MMVDVQVGAINLLIRWAVLLSALEHTNVKHEIDCDERIIRVFNTVDDV